MKEDARKNYAWENEMMILVRFNGIIALKNCTSVLELKFPLVRFFFYDSIIIRSTK